MGSEIQSRKEGWRRVVPGEKHKRKEEKTNKRVRRRTQALLVLEAGATFWGVL